MIFKRISIIPFEFFSTGNRLRIETKLVEDAVIIPVLSGLNEIIQEVTLNSSRLYKCSPDNQDILLSFAESSLCIILTETQENINIDKDFVTNELVARKKLHSDIITGSPNNKINNLYKKIESLDPKETNWNINYVFSFYVIIGRENLAEEDMLYIKLLAEPSLVELDDMISCASTMKNIEAAELKSNYLEGIKDADISGKADTYITWATLVSIVNNDEDWERTLNLLSALEVRLQSVWNRCYTYSKFIDLVFDKSIIVKNIDDTNKLAERRDQQASSKT